MCASYFWRTIQILPLGVIKTHTSTAALHFLKDFGILGGKKEKFSLPANKLTQ